MAPSEASLPISGRGRGLTAVPCLSTISVGHGGGPGALTRLSAGRGRRASRVEKSGTPTVSAAVISTAGLRYGATAIGRAFTSGRCASGRAVMASIRGPPCKVRNFRAVLTFICPSAVVTYVDID